MTKDEKEMGIRAILNFGHTFGHAIEAHGKFKKILHGEGVAKGMLIASNISFLEGMISKDELLNIKSLLEHFKFDLSLHEYKYSDLKPFIFRDKKIKQGTLNLVLLNGIARGFVTDQFDRKNLRRSMII